MVMPTGKRPALKVPQAETPLKQPNRLANRHHPIRIPHHLTNRPIHHAGKPQPTRTPDPDTRPNKQPQRPQPPPLPHKPQPHQPITHQPPHHTPPYLVHIHTKGGGRPEDKEWEWIVNAFGEQGPELAEQLAATVRAWDQRVRADDNDQHADPILTVHPAGSPDGLLPAGGRPGQGVVAPPVPARMTARPHPASDLFTAERAVRGGATTGTDS
ncbi:hypothetical protein [Streptomyces sp. CC53]|uniref:hypothetical protein n=1 Tax=Streptomyces sp. CC53 TaxID=1906740 RepID=UPI0015A64E99|nr:hypothetical protein [Streptomyces sp. CC53]